MKILLRQMPIKDLSGGCFAILLSNEGLWSAGVGRTSYPSRLCH